MIVEVGSTSTPTSASVFPSDGSHGQTAHRNDAGRLIEDAPDLHVRRAALARESRRPERREPGQARGDMKRQHEFV